MDFIQLNYECYDAKIAITLNGFPVLESANGGSGGQPLDLWCLADNTLTITATPNKPTHLLLRIARESQDQMVSTNEDAPGIININEDLSSAKTYTLTFKTPDKTLGKRLTGTPLNAQEAITYAKNLAARLMEKSDVSSDFMPKFEDYAALYEKDIQTFTKGFSQYLYENFPCTYTPDKITVRQITPTVYELLHDGKPFFIKESKNQKTSLKVYAGKTNGKVFVVR